MVQGIQSTFKADTDRFTRDVVTDRLRNLWKDYHFELGIPVIDLQHIYLLYTFIELGAVCDRGDEELISTEYEKAFSSILDFTSEHFFLEADIFQNFDFPGKRAHLGEHRHFIERMKRRTRERIEGSGEVARKLTGDLMSWLFQHILKEDRKFTDYYLQNHIYVDDYTRHLVEESHVYITPFQLQLYQEVTGSRELLQVVKENISMTVFHLWKNYDLSLQIPVLDMQNLWFLNLMVRMDRVSRITNRGKRKEELLRGLELLIQFSTDHFRTEELLMDHFDFPDTGNHRKEHERFLALLHKRKREAEVEGNRVAGYLAQDLKEWLLSHIAIGDKHFLLFFRGFRQELNGFVRDLLSRKEIQPGKGPLNLYRTIRDLQNQSAH